MPSTQITLGLIIASALVLALSFTPSKWIPHRKHCYVTGGSSGLGLALAILLTQRGANVSIVARDETRLKRALEALEAVRKTPEQFLKSYSFSLADAKESADALEAACEPFGGRAPDAVFLCAGTSTPGFFVEQDEASLRLAMDNSYWVAAWSALAAVKYYVRDRAPGKIVLVSSLLGMTSIVGYSTYSPVGSRFLPRNDLQPGIQNLTKPEITKKIEETDGGMSPKDCAMALLRGVELGQFNISADFLGNIFRASTRGGTPHNNVTDIVYSVIGWIGLSIWRKTVDATVVGHRATHDDYLHKKRFTEAGK